MGLLSIPTVMKPTGSLSNNFLHTCQASAGFAQQTRSFRCSTSFMRLAPALSCAFIIAGLGACGSTIKTATPVTTAVATATTAAASATTAKATGSTVAAGQQGGQGGGQGGQAQLTPEEQAARQAYRDCLTANGLVIPTRGNGQGGGQGAPGNAPAGSQNPAGGAADPNTPDPSAPPTSDNNTPRPTIDPAALAKAQDACKDKVPPGGAGNIFGGGNRQGANGQARAAALAPYYSCLKDNGIKVADAPTTTTTVAGATTVPGSNPPRPGGPRGGRLAGVDQTTPEFIAANDKCKVLVPAGTNLAGQGGQGGAAPTTATTVAP